MRERVSNKKNTIMKRLVLCLVLAILAIGARGQSDTARVALNGYVKNLQSLYFFNGSFPDLRQFKLVDTVLQDNLLHWRLNFNWRMASHLNLNAGLRTRVFYGDLVKATPLYADQIDAGSNDWVDLSTVWLDKRGFVGHSVLDRLYLEYTKDKLEIRLGRQRVNWGISTIWNPNDIFNAYSFTDFDYEERPGSDALRVRYYTGYAGSVEVAVRGADSLGGMIMAGRWLFNKGSYDIQLIGGYAQKDLVLGGGWAGNIKNAGFKGEATWFYRPEDKESVFALTANVDYAFANSLYLNGGFLYNSAGATDQDILNLFTFDLSARNLYPYRWATFVQGSYPVTPLLNAGVAVIYSPVKVHPLFVNPTFTLSISDNWTLDAVGQVVLSKGDEGYRSPLQVAFLRVKVNY